MGVPKKDDPLLEQQRIDVVGSLAAPGRLDDHRNQAILHGLPPDFRSEGLKSGQGSEGSGSLAIQPPSVSVHPEAAWFCKMAPTASGSLVRLIARAVLNSLDLGLNLHLSLNF